MTINLRDYDRGYFGYLNEEVREELALIQDRGQFRLLTPAQRAAYTNGVAGDWTADFVEKQVYVWNVSSEQFEAIGASLTEVQSLIDGSFNGGDTTILASNTSVPADGTAGLADPTGQTAGWYYKNSNSLTDKINWYYLANTNPALVMTKGALDGMYAIVDVRAGGAPYFVVYTSPTGTNDAQPWYKSRFVYSPAGLDLTAYIGQQIFLYWGNDPGDFINLPRVECTLDAVSSEGPQDPAEQILFGNLSTSTGYGAGRYEFVVSELAYDYANNVFGFELSSIGAQAPAQGDTHFVTLDGVNDYITLTGAGSCMDFSAGATWTLGFTVDHLYPGNADKQAPVSSGTNYWALYNGGLHSTFGNNVAALNWNSAAYMTALTAGDKIAIRANGTQVQVWLNGVLKDSATLGTQGVTTGGSPGTLNIGAAVTTATVGAVPNWATSVDNLMVCGSADLTDAELGEFFASNDFALYSFAGTKLTDFVTMGEDAYPNITGENSVVTGTLVNGTASNFVERV